MTAEYFYNCIVQPVFEGDLKDCFTDVFGKDVYTTFLTFDVYGFIWLGDINEYNSINKVVSFLFLNDELKYCGKYDDVCYVKFIFHPVFQNYLGDIKDFTQYFKEKHDNTEYIKKEFLRVFKGVIYE